MEDCANRKAPCKQHCSEEPPHWPLMSLHVSAHCSFTLASAQHPHSWMAYSLCEYLQVSVWGDQIISFCLDIQYFNIESPNPGKSLSPRKPGWWSTLGETSWILLEILCWAHEAYPLRTHKAQIPYSQHFPYSTPKHVMISLSGADGQVFKILELSLKHIEEITKISLIQLLPSDSYMFLFWIFIRMSSSPDRLKLQQRWERWLQLRLQTLALVPW